MFVQEGGDTFPGMSELDVDVSVLIAGSSMVWSPPCSVIGGAGSALADITASIEAGSASRLPLSEAAAIGTGGDSSSE